MGEVRQFVRASEILQYGKMLGDFDDAMKGLPAGLSYYGVGVDYVQGIAGEGPYNALHVGKGFDRYTRYGPDQYRDMRGAVGGLFGAFGIIHLPEIMMANRAPKILGEKHGFQFYANVDGERYVVPLQNVQWDFVPRIDRMREENGALVKFTQEGRITLKEPVTLVSKNDPAKTITLDAGTAVVHDISGPARKRYYGKWFTRVWNDDNTAAFGIENRGGTIVEEQNMVPMLWAHLQANHGLKRQGRGTAAFTTFQTDGVDDDFQAEGAMTQMIASVDYSSKTDLLAQYNGFVRSASERLSKQPEMLKVVARSILVAETLKLFYATESTGSKQDWEEALADIVGSADHLRASMEMLGIDLPKVELEAADMDTIAAIKTNVPIYRAAEQIWHSTSGDPLGDWRSGSCYSITSPNALRHALDGLDPAVYPKVEQRFIEVAREKTYTKFVQSLPRTSIDMSRLMSAFPDDAQVSGALGHAKAAIDDMHEALRNHRPPQDMPAKMDALRGAVAAIEGSKSGAVKAHAKSLRGTLRILEQAQGDLRQLSPIYSDCAHLGIAKYRPESRVPQVQISGAQSAPMQARGQAIS